MIIKLLKKIKREFKINGGLNYKTRQKILFLESNHPGVYKRMVEMNNKLLFRSWNSRNKIF